MSSFLLFVLLLLGLPASAEETAKKCALFPLELLDAFPGQTRESVWMSHRMTRAEAEKVLAEHTGEERLEIICKDDPAWDRRMQTDPEVMRVRRIAE